MRVEVVPRVRIRSNGTIEVVLWKMYYDAACDSHCPICGQEIECPYNKHEEPPVERFHHKDAYVAEDGCWITVGEGAEIPDKCKIATNELVAEIHGLPNHGREITGSDVHRSLMGSQGDGYPQPPKNYMPKFPGEE